MNKVLTVALMILMTVLAGKALATEQGPKLRYYSCDATIAQYLKLKTYEDVGNVLDKSTCTLISEADIDKALKTARRATSSKSMNGDYGLYLTESVALKIYDPESKQKTVFCDGQDKHCLARGLTTEKMDSLFVFTEEQVFKIAENLEWAQEYDRSLSIYFMKHQASFRLRGLPNPFFLCNLQKAEVLVESPSN